MLNFGDAFFSRLFESLDNNSMILAVDESGAYRPVWCSREYAEMMEGNVEECLRYETAAENDSVHADDRDEVAYLFQHHKTRDGKNSLTIRKLTLKDNEIWVNVHYAFVKEAEVQYAYCNYTDVTELKHSQQQALAMYQELNEELEALSSQSLAALRSNLTKGVVEKAQGIDLYDVDREGMPIEDLMRVRLDNMPVASDRENYLKTFDLQRLREKYDRGEGVASIVILSRRQSGRQCFIKCSASMRKDPLTDDVIVLGVETEYNSQKVSEVLNEKVLASQYDMVCYIIADHYGISIGDAKNIKRGNIFPRERNGIYMDYIREQVLPHIRADQRERMSHALSLDTITKNLEHEESYSIDVECLIEDEIFHKRFTYYVVDKETGFYILLKSDITDLIKEQREREHSQTIHNSMLNQFHDLAQESLTVVRSNMGTGLVEDVRGNDLYPGDYAGNTIAAFAQSRLDNLLIEEDRRKYIDAFDIELLLDRAENGLGPSSIICYSKRASGRQCFVKYSGSASRNPVTGNVDAFGIETEYDAEMVSQVMNGKVLAEQYDMITYLVRGHYAVTIGDASKIQKGSIFPKEHNGIYMDYIKDQVVPVIAGEEDEKSRLLRALSLETIEDELLKREPYIVDVSCYIEGEMFNKRFMFYSVDREKHFYLLLKSDVTDVLREQKAQNELLAGALDEAERANMAKTAFLSTMSHEIRTPMNAIIGLDTIALQEPDLKESTREYLEKIGASARHLLGLINDILDMSRIESGRMVIRKEEFSFADMLAQINTMVSGQCRDEGLLYECQVLNKVAHYYIGDNMKLKQVIINILGNAVKFTPVGGKITFTVEQTVEFERQATLRFVIKDTGIGMDREFLPRIFDAFSQEDSGKANKYGSTGLGMAITRNIVEMMNGHISVDSEKGKGTTFTVDVTLRASEHENGAESHETIKMQDLKVLVIDDDPVDCHHAKIALEDLGITPDVCMSGKEAIETIEVKIARHEAYDLILVDWKMPEQDGVDVTRQIRKIVGSESAVVVLTAYNWYDIEAEALEAGVDHFMAKPLFSDSVMSAYQKAKSRKRTKEAEHTLSDLKGRRVLLAEDMAVNAEIMKMLLSLKEIEADLAENGRIAVEKFSASEENYYDAILMDIRMPVLDGLGAAEAIRALPRPDAKRIPIIAMTANAFDEDVQRSLQAGMNAHLSKPVEQDKLFLTLGELIKPPTFPA
ncbi:MAG: response regulator [Selenomonadaceae bacterium]|nr:response regulator [Selenomonadaceae bacterium]